MVYIAVDDQGTDLSGRITVDASSSTDISVTADYQPSSETYPFSEEIYIKATACSSNALTSDWKLTINYPLCEDSSMSDPGT